MKYIKNGKINDGTFLETEHGCIFNPTHEDYVRAGWKEHKMPKKEDKKLQIDSIRRDILQECQNYYMSTVERVWLGEHTDWMHFEERSKLRTLVEDLSDEYEEFEFLGQTVKVTDLLKFLKEMNKYEYKIEKALQKHIKAIRELNSKEALLEYDYTEGYPEVLVLK